MDPFWQDGSSAPSEISGFDDLDFAFSGSEEESLYADCEEESWLEKDADDYVQVVRSNKRVQFTVEQLIQHYLAVSVAVGHPARGHELAQWAKQQGGPTPYIYFRELGSLHIVRSLAKLQDGAFLERDEMSSCYAALCQRLAKLAGSRDIEAAAKQGKGPTYYRYMQVFGTLAALQKEAQVEFPDKRRELVFAYRSLAYRLGRTPDSDDIAHAHAKTRLATRKHYENVFGSLTQFQQSLGMPPSYRTLRWPWTPVLLFQHIDKLRVDLGRLPEAFDVIEAERKPRFLEGKRVANPKLSHFQYWFGSFQEALYQGGFVKTGNGNQRMWDSFAKELRAARSPGLERSITIAEVKRAAKRGTITPPWILVQWFGGIEQACRYAGMNLVKTL